MSTSNYRAVSLGIVVEDKPKSTDIILVSPIEELTQQDSGPIKDQSGSFKGDMKSTGSVNFKSEHSSKNYVKATWRSVGNGNRTSAPDVGASETVLLYKYGDIDEYYWDDVGREPSLRKLEDVLYSYSNLPGQGSYDKSTSYSVHVSTREKFIHIHTANNDGEPCTYDLKIDTAKGIFTVVDGLGNSMTLNSVAGVHETIMNTEIIRKAPKITDIAEQHIVQASVSVTQASTITNDTPNLVNTGNMVTEGNVTNKGDVTTAGKDIAAGGNFNAVL